MSHVPSSPERERGIAELLDSLSPEATALLATVVTSEAAFEGVRELRDRFKRGGEVPAMTRRMGSATSVAVDPAKWRHFFWMRRIPLNSIGRMMEPERCDAWGSSVASKRRASYYSLDAVGCAIGMRVEDLIEAVCTEAELERLAVCV